MPIPSIYIWLSLCKDINYIIDKLLEVFKSPEAIYNAKREELVRACRLKESQLKSLCNKNLDVANRILEQCLRNDISLLQICDKAYPYYLRNIKDPPALLYLRGHMPDFNAHPGIAVVGTRKATNYGCRASYEIGQELAAAGFTTVSGMALGADGEAHRGALNADGPTVAVLAGGVDVCYPVEHQGLMEDIIRSGAVVSEQPPGTKPLAQNYYQRNRIISGMCLATVVTEAGNDRSGALITVRRALDQDRDVYAVPGAWGMKSSECCNKLIENFQATLLRNPSALVDEYKSKIGRQPDAPYPLQSSQKAIEGVSREQEVNTPEQQVTDNPTKPWKSQSGVQAESDEYEALISDLSEDEKKIIGLVEEGKSDVDDVINEVEFSVSKVQSLITNLELKGVLEYVDGKLVLNL